VIPPVVRVTWFASHGSGKKDLPLLEGVGFLVAECPKTLVLCSTLDPDRPLGGGGVDDTLLVISKASIANRSEIAPAVNEGEFPA